MEILNQAAIMTVTLFYGLMTHLAITWSIFSQLPEITWKTHKLFITLAEHPVILRANKRLLCDHKTNKKKKKTSVPVLQTKTFTSIDKEIIWVTVLLVMLQWTKRKASDIFLTSPLWLEYISVWGKWTFIHSFIFKFITKWSRVRHICALSVCERLSCPPLTLFPFYFVFSSCYFQSFRSQMSLLVTCSSQFLILLPVVEHTNDPVPLQRHREELSPTVSAKTCSHLETLACFSAASEVMKRS